VNRGGNVSRSAGVDVLHRPIKVVVEKAGKAVFNDIGRKAA
jgi:hypothetical protein